MNIRVLRVFCRLVAPSGFGKFRFFEYAKQALLATGRHIRNASLDEPAHHFHVQRSNRKRLQGRRT